MPLNQNEVLVRVIQGAIMKIILYKLDRCRILELASLTEKDISSSKCVTVMGYRDIMERTQDWKLPEFQHSIFSL